MWKGGSMIIKKDRISIGAALFFKKRTSPLRLLAAMATLWICVHMGTSNTYSQVTTNCEEFFTCITNPASTQCALAAGTRCLVNRTLVISRPAGLPQLVIGDESGSGN